MKHLNDFIYFDFDSWAEGKEFQVISVKKWEDREMGTTLGKVVETVILKDDCKNYRLKKDEEFDLVYEKVIFKAIEADVKKGDHVSFVNPHPVVYVNNDFINVSFKVDEVIIKKIGEGGKKL